MIFASIDAICSLSPFLSCAMCSWTQVMACGCLIINEEVMSLLQSWPVICNISNAFRGHFQNNTECLFPLTKFNWAWRVCMTLLTVMIHCSSKLGSSFVASVCSETAAECFSRCLDKQQKSNSPWSASVIFLPSTTHAWFISSVWLV